jgi:hypothetical protein
MDVGTLIVDVMKSKNASLPEATLASVESSRIFQSRFTGSAALAAPPGSTAISQAATALQNAQGASLLPAETAKTPSGPISLGDALLRSRAIVSGKVAFEERTVIVDQILQCLNKNIQQASTELYGNCLTELARGIVRREIPMNRHPQITQLFVSILDPRAPKLHPPLLRKLVRLFASMIGFGLVPPEAVNAATAVMLYQMTMEHWSSKERALSLEGLLWGVYHHGYTELFRSATVGRVLRIVADQKHPVAADDLVRLAVPLSSSLCIRKVTSGQTAEVVKLIVNALHTHRGTVPERGLLALNVSAYMNEDFSFTPPIEDLNLVASIPELDPVLRTSIHKKIRRQPESYYRSLSR